MRIKNRIYGDKLINPVVELKHIKHEDFITSNVGSYGVCVTHESIEELVDDFCNIYNQPNINKTELVNHVKQSLLDRDYGIMSELSDSIVDNLADTIFDYVVMPKLANTCLGSDDYGLTLPYSKKIAYRAYARDYKYAEHVIDLIVYIDSILPNEVCESYIEYDKLIKTIDDKFGNNKLALDIIGGFIHYYRPKNFPWDK